MNMIAPNLEYAAVWEGNTKFFKLLETVKMAAAKQILGCSSTTSDTLLRTKLGM